MTGQGLCADRYIGLSSTGISSRSGSASFGSSSFRSNDRYGGFGNTRDSDRTVDSYKGRARFGDDKYEKSTSKPCRTVSGDNQGDGSKRDSSRYGRLVSNFCDKISKQSSYLFWSFLRI